MNDDDGYVSYRGKTSTVVSYRPKERRWLMRMVTNPEVWAVSNASMASLIMGQWDACESADDVLLRAPPLDSVQ
jgi:hypothetical protein